MVAAIAGLGCVWLVCLLIDTMNLWRWLAEIDRASQLDLVQGALAQGSVGTDDPGAADDDAGALLDPEDRFRQFCADASVRPGLIADHIRAIYFAGQQKSRLEVGELLSHTLGRLLRPTRALQMSLGLFLVLGLLGTLGGLAGLLSEFNLNFAVAAGEEAQDTNQTVLRGLLSGLGGAFSPSIYGIAATIIGTLLLTVRGSLVGGRCQTRLEQATLTVWVPECLPKSAGRMVDEVAAQIRLNADAVHEVNVLAGNVRGDLEAWNATLENATAQMNVLAGTANTFREGTAAFATAVETFGTTQQGLNTAFETFANEGQASRTWFQEATIQAGEQHAEAVRTIREHQTTLQQQVTAQRVEAGEQHAEAVRMIRELQTTLQQQVMAQGVELHDAFAALQAYEAAYVEQRQAMDAAIQAVLVQTTALAEETRTTLTESVQEGLTAVQAAVTVQLTAVNATLANLGNPLDAAANTLDGVSVNLTQRHEQTLVNLRAEFEAQNQANTQRTAALLAQTEALTTLVTAVQKQVRAQDAARTTLGAQLDAVTTQMQQVTTKMQQVTTKMQQVLQRGLVGSQSVGGTVRARIRSVWQGWRDRPPEDR
jgi:hypothetical protein